MEQAGSCKSGIRAHFQSDVNESNSDAIPAAPSLPPPLLSREEPWNGWWTLLWAVLLFLVWQTVMTAGLAIAAFQQGALKDLADFAEAVESLAFDGDVLGVIAFATLFIICPLCWFLGRLRPGFSGWSYLGNRSVAWWHWPLWGVATVACSVVFGAVAPSLGVDGPDDSMVAMASSTEFPLLLFLGVGIGAPLVEEFIFRGALWRGWRASRMGLVGTLLLTSLLWAVLHVQYPTVIMAYIFVLGLLLGWAREKTGNLWVPVSMHMLNNSLATVQMLQA